ncbi:MAG: hypothetical protein CL565_04875 [Alphaproteobacteria bacterium]|nr:hypothetical protein [Alphaproteobacteria bacterium]|tara:strand:+ start:1201 stop:1878 length:678 start_codon:yes stop_codon:yes gene_type:complete
MTRFLKIGKTDGNIFFYILLGVFLFGALTYALMQDDVSSSDTSLEEMNVAYSQILQYQGELRQAVQNIFDNGASETDIRFAHPSASSDYGSIGNKPQFQVFSPEGGAATYRTPPVAAGSVLPWLFSGRANMPGVGSQEMDLVAIIPDVSEKFCSYFNDKEGLSITPYPTDTGTCLVPVVSGFRFNGVFAGNAVDKATFSKVPAPEACIHCEDNGKYYISVTIYER